MYGMICPNKGVLHSITRAIQHHVVQPGRNAWLHNVGRLGPQASSLHALQRTNPRVYGNTIPKQNPGPLSTADRLQDILMPQLGTAARLGKELSQLCRASKNRLRNPPVKDLCLHLCEHSSRHQRPKLLSHNTKHALVMDEQERPHVVETKQTHLAKHLGLQRQQLTLVQLQPQLDNLFDHFSMMSLERARATMAVGPDDAVQLLATAVFWIREQPQIRGGYQPRPKAKPSLQVMHHHVNVHALLFGFQQMKGNVDAEEAQ